MKIPKIISFNDREYIIIKEYERYILYKDMITGSKQCFNKQELGLIKQKVKVTEGARLKDITGLKV